MLNFFDRHRRITDAAIIVLALIGLAHCCMLFGTLFVQSGTENEYPSTAIVSAVNYEYDTVTVQDCVGREYTMHGASDWNLRDIVSLTMSDNATPDDYHDDQIVQARFSGTSSSFLWHEGVIPRYVELSGSH